jgi:cobalt-precorrin-5B (C1)-methyltransferase
MVDTRILRHGWTTGACATAAAKAAWAALCGDGFPDPVEIVLPRGERVAFVLAESGFVGESAFASVVKDAGDDPDVTHGALIRVRLRRLPPGSGIQFRAGEGVGMVTRPGLPIPPGEPAINPMPRQMIRTALGEADVEVEIAIPGGEEMARHTLNGRLGIVGGLSVLGTTGIVVPFSCAAWIDTIHRGIDVARAMGLEHVAGATGRASEEAVQAMFGLADPALIDMGDFVGGMLKYLRTHPVARVTVAGGIGKMVKLAQGRLDLHSKRGSVDLPALAALAGQCGGSDAVQAQIIASNTAAEALGYAEGLHLGDAIAEAAWRSARDVLGEADVALDVLVFNHQGALMGHHERNRRR